jgi:transcriptional regulator with XRE-family HTH domain
MINSKSKSLGELLKELREANKLTLREMEKQTGISNAYLSQVENGQIKKPSPNYLFKISEALNYPYESLMERAGFVVPSKDVDPSDKSESNGRLSKESKAFAIFSSIKDLTEDEAEALVEFLNWRRSRQEKKRDER